MQSLSSTYTQEATSSSGNSQRIELRVQYPAQEERMPHPLPVIPDEDVIIPAAYRCNAERRALIHRITTTVTDETAAFSNVLLPLAQLDDEQSQLKEVTKALRFASTRNKTQNAACTAERIWNDYLVEEAQPDQLYHLVCAVAAKDEPLGPESRRILNQRLQWYRNHGLIGVDAKTRRDFIETRHRISQLCTRFSRSQQEIDGNYLLFSTSDLHGVCQEKVARLPFTADGRRIVPLTPAFYNIIMMQAHSSDTRRRMYTAGAQRCPENIDVFRETILLRNDNAKRLGYATHADARLQERMMPSVPAAHQMLTTLGDKLLPLSNDYYDDLRDRKAQTDKGGIKLNDWDFQYLHGLGDAEGIKLEAQLQEYFPFDQTVNATLNKIMDLFQLEARQLSTEGVAGHVWAPDITVYSVWDTQQGAFIGYLYLDLHDRPNKHKGNQTINIQPGYVRPDGQRTYPATCLIASFRPRMLDGIPLLSHANVITVFHELGHALHDLLSRTSHSCFHGHRVCLEFGEAIGTLMENWAWHHDGVGVHYTRVSQEARRAWTDRHPGVDLPEAHIPRALLETLAERRRKRRICATLTQV